MKKKRRVSLPLIRSKEPGTLNIDNAKIDELLSMFGTIDYDPSYDHKKERLSKQVFEDRSSGQTKGRTKARARTKR